MELQEVLKKLSPALLSYDEWLEVGAALYHSGYDCSLWDDWSRADSRYKDGDCESRWRGFGDYVGTSKTEASIFHLAKQYGIDIRDSASMTKSDLDWDNTFFVDKDFIEDKTLVEPVRWEQKKQIIDFLSTLFRPEEYVGFVLASMEKDGKFIPANAGSYKRTCGEIIADLEKNDIEHALGSYNPNAGGWVRFNPLDGEGCKAANVAEYRYCLVESDDMSIEKQYAMFTELRLPIATLTHSGGKSLHAIVKVNAPNRHEYQKRFEYIQKVCENSGFSIDKATKDPSRLSRLAGLYRNGRKQYLVATNIGCDSWDEWITYIEQLKNDMPEAVSLADIIKEDIPKGEQLIEGVLYRGHKMLVSGSSKAGKSSLLLELGLALASGTEWLGFKCKQCKVLYFNFEVQEDRFNQRIKNLYSYSGVGGADNFRLVNLKGKAQPLKKMTNYILRLCEGQNYSAIIFDPIYKIMNGNESDSEVVTEFTNQLDIISDKLNAAVIYCHHHSKGFQGEKNAMDRASGSGVFARDADAIFDLIELDIKEKKREEFVQPYKERWYKMIYESLGHEVSAITEHDILELHKRILTTLKAQDKEEFLRSAADMEKSCENVTAWRFETVLRHFANQKPKCVWFCYPFHYVDSNDALARVKPKGSGKSEEEAEKEWERKFDMVRENYPLYCEEEKQPVGSFVKKAKFAEFIEVNENTLKSWIKRMAKQFNDVEDDNEGDFRIFNNNNL